MSKKKHKKVNSVPNNTEEKKVEEVKVIEKEEKMITIEEMKALRNSVKNFEVPELNIPSASKIVIKGDEDKDEQADLLDKLLTEDDFDKKPKKKKIKAPEKEIDLMVEKDEPKNEETSKEEDETIDIPVITKKSKEVHHEEKVEVPAKPKKEKVETPKKEIIKEEKVKPHPHKEEAKPKKKRKKKINYKNLFKLIFKIVLAILIIWIILKAFGALFNNKNIKVKSNIPNDVGIGDYTEAPLTNYGIYKTIPETIKGVYLSEYTMASNDNVEKWINICKQKEINALVINVKNDDGHLAFEVDYDVAHSAGADEYRSIKDPAELVLRLKQNGIFPIARIVSFKDPFLANHKSYYAIKDGSGSVLKIKSGNNWEAWVNPYNTDLWDYIINVSKCAADVGFKEIQYDYIRFATGPQLESAAFGFESATKSKRDIILEFSRYAKRQLEDYGVYLSADVFGTIITSDYDAQIVGQNYLEMGKIYDFICPMIYPSHYANGSMGITYPDLDPYQTVYNALDASNKLLDQIPEGEHRAEVRAWLQDFTAAWVKPHQTYGAKQLREQKQAVYDSGNTEWLLWNASNKYSLDGLN